MKASKLLGYVLCIAMVAGHQGFAQAAGDPALGRQKAVVCISCHGENGMSAGPNVPHLNGQRSEYLVNSLKAYKSRGRSDPLAVLMYPFVDKLSEQDMLDLAAFYSSLTGATPEEE